MRWALLIVFGIAGIGVVASAVTRTFVRAYVIPSESMMPTLLPGDRVFFNMTAYGLRAPLVGAGSSPSPPTRGDIAVLQWGDDGTMFVERIIGLPGETIAIRDKQVFIDDVALDEPYAVHADAQIKPEGLRDNLPPLVIPPGQIFVLGDNRDRSYDSRFRGLLGVEALRGRAGVIYFSWDEEKQRVRWERIGHRVGAAPGLR